MSVPKVFYGTFQIPNTLGITPPNESCAPNSMLSGRPGKASLGGATKLSPALQRWEKKRKRLKSRTDGRVLKHTPEVYTSRAKKIYEKS
jgi:hypothetical protein